jgi:two-component system KDP operon response regulator KdpE
MNQMLIVDDDKEFRETLIRTLKNEGYRAVGIDHPDGITSNMAVYQPQVVLLDMMFGSEMMGLVACQRLRTWSSVPVIIVSAVNDEDIKVQALDAGADDYITKPFGINELLARVRAVQRRQKQQNGHIGPILTVGELSIDFNDRLVKVGDSVVHLTRKEFTLLKALADARGRLVTYEKLMETIWKDEEVTDRGKVRGLVMQLRKKLGENLTDPTYVRTEAGIGYRLDFDG